MDFYEQPGKSDDAKGMTERDFLPSSKFLESFSISISIYFWCHLACSVHQWPELMSKDSTSTWNSWEKTQNSNSPHRKVLTHLAAVGAAISAEDGWSPAQHRHSPACSLFLHPALDLNFSCNCVRSRWLLPQSRPRCHCEGSKSKYQHYSQVLTNYSLHLGQVCGREVVTSRHQSAQTVHLQQTAAKQRPVFLGLWPISPFSRGQVVNLKSSVTKSLWWPPAPGWSRSCQGPRPPLPAPPPPWPGSDLTWAGPERGHPGSRSSPRLRHDKFIDGHERFFSIPSMISTESVGPSSVSPPVTTRQPSTMSAAAKLLATWRSWR